ncbi:DUF3293 domain-containing protein [Vibrio sp. JPW-9-11-11]|nr:DUF3293 domain-containing protein [Vibrio sp. JPW-9-11-11]
MSIDAELWRAYQQPYFRFEALPKANQFAIITAWNPSSVWCSLVDNDRNNQCLAADLVHTGYSCVLVGDQNFTWAEESFAAPISLEQAVVLGQKYAQNAIYFIDGEQLFLLSCQDETPPLLLGEWRHRCR